jgi:hypothetical protein
MTDWQPIETAPKDGTHILIYDAYGECSVVYWFTYDNGNDCGWTYDGGDRFDPSHWMPLPDPPKETNE